MLRIGRSLLLPSAPRTSLLTMTDYVAAASSKSTVEVTQAAYPHVDPAIIADRVIDGEAVSQRVLRNVTEQVAELKRKHRVTPGLAVVLVCVAASDSTASLAAG